MRGRDDRSEGLFSYIRLEERIPADHPLRPIKAAHFADGERRFHLMVSAHFV
jgi:hypothetical protein